MNIEDVRDYILRLPNVEEIEQFADILVYKVAGKWFAIYIFERPECLAVKCNPDRALALRDKYPAITPAWHFNKKHWNDIKFEALPSDIVEQEIRHSYLSVIRKNVTPKSVRRMLLDEAQKAGVTDATEEV